MNLPTIVEPLMMRLMEVVQWVDLIFFNSDIGLSATSKMHDPYGMG